MTGSASRSICAFCPSPFGAATSPNGTLHTYLGSNYCSIGYSSFITANFKTTYVPILKMSSSPTGLPVFSPQADGPSNFDGHELRTTEHRGEGIFATRPFSPGEVVVEGVIVAEVGANHSHATQVALDRYVQHGGLNSFVNHSCDPNCGIKLNAEGGNDIVAMRQIQVSEEVTFDYAMRNYKIEHFPKECLCGAPECRKTITGYKDLPRSFKKKYEGFIAPYLQEMDNLSQKKLDS